MTHDKKPIVHILSNPTNKIPFPFFLLFYLLQQHTPTPAWGIGLAHEVLGSQHYF